METLPPTMQSLDMPADSLRSMPYNPLANESPRSPVGVQPNGGAGVFDDVRYGKQSMPPPADDPQTSTLALPNRCELTPAQQMYAIEVPLQLGCMASTPRAAPRVVDIGVLPDVRISAVPQELLTPSSMKHESWQGSDTTEGPVAPMTLISTTTVTVSVGLGLGLGFGVGLATGLSAAAITFGGVGIIFMGLLISYMMLYSGGLKDNRMGSCVRKLGFVFNIRANLVCRSLLTCCYNGAVDMLNFVMRNEAGETLDSIRQIPAQNGHSEGGPAPGGVCFLGDSEFTFWKFLREDMAAFHPNCFNAGFGGSRSLDLMTHVKPLCLDWDPSIVIVHAAGNDFDFEPDMKTEEMPKRLIKLFETLAAHPSVEKIGYMLSSRRPVYSDVKWAFMIQVHAMTIDLIQNHNELKDLVKVIDLRDMVHPLEDFVSCDRVHLNQTGHFKKSQVLVPMLLGIWPKSVDSVLYTSSSSVTPSSAEVIRIRADSDYSNSEELMSSEEPDMSPMSVTSPNTVEVIEV